MQPDTNVINFPNTDNTDYDGPTFVAWKFDDGAIIITVEGFDQDVDGETLLTFTPQIGVERGPSKVLAMVDERSVLLFRGTYSEQRAIFDEWRELAKGNDRPTIYREQGLSALARLPEQPVPRLPEIDEEQTARANEALKGEREMLSEAIEQGRSFYTG